MPDKRSLPLRRKTSSTGSGKKRPEPQVYTVHVEDNFSAMVRDTRWTLGTYDTYENAVDAAKQFVESALKSAYQPGMTGQQLLDHYAHFGDEPFILPPPEGQRPFLVRAYAADIADDICRAESTATRLPTDEPKTM